MKTTESEVIKVDHQNSIYNNRLLSSATQNIEARQKHLRKNSDQSLRKQRKQSSNSIKATNQQELIGQSNKILVKKKISTQSVSDQSNFNAPSINIIPVSQQQEIKERLQQDQKRDYLASKVTPTLNKMLVKIINHKPKDILGFMIDFLKDQQDKFEKKRFNDKPPNDAIIQNKHLEEVFNSTVASKFLKFKK